METIPPILPVPALATRLNVDTAPKARSRNKSKANKPIPENSHKDSSRQPIDEIV